MNWSRGFMRLWLAGSIVWAITICVWAYGIYRDAVDTAAHYGVNETAFTWADLFFALAVIVAVPAIVLAIGGIIGWILRGFVR